MLSYVLVRCMGDDNEVLTDSIVILTEAEKGLLAAQCVDLIKQIDREIKSEKRLERKPNVGKNILTA